jgi:hypothetical protein
MNQYRVEQTEYGVVIYGSLPVDDLVAFSKAWKKRGLIYCRIDIASVLGATLVVTDEKRGELWLEEVKANAKRLADGDAELEWIKGPDTGMSSLTIMSVLSEKYHQPGRHEVRGEYPLDPDDFGRCYRLLERFPEWRKRLAEVAAKYPKWKPLVDAWGELEELWRKESPTGTCKQLYKRMRELRGTF